MMIEKVDSWILVVYFCILICGVVLCFWVGEVVCVDVCFVGLEFFVVGDGEGGVGCCVMVFFLLCCFCGGFYCLDGGVFCFFGCV